MEMHVPMDIHMHKVVASDLFLWADLSGKRKQKCLMEFHNKAQSDCSYKWYFECKKKLEKRVAFYSSFSAISMNFTTGGIYAEVENS